MAIKYYCMPEQKKIIGVLNDCQYDVINKIDKICMDTGFDFWADERFIMPRTFKAEAVARDGDEFNEEIGKEIVRKKIMKRYRASYNKRVDLFKCMIINLTRKVDRKK